MEGLNILTFTLKKSDKLTFQKINPFKYNYFLDECNASKQHEGICLNLIGSNKINNSLSYLTFSKLLNKQETSIHTQCKSFPNKKWNNKFLVFFLSKTFQRFFTRTEEYFTWNVIYEVSSVQIINENPGGGVMDVFPNIVGKGSLWCKHFKWHPFVFYFISINKFFWKIYSRVLFDTLHPSTYVHLWFGSNFANSRE